MKPLNWWWQRPDAWQNFRMKQIFIEYYMLYIMQGYPIILATIFQDLYLNPCFTDGETETNRGLVMCAK